MTEHNPNDEIRRVVLGYFYDRNSRATSRFGRKGSAVRISDVKRELKRDRQLSQQQVMSNLTYLIDRGWIKTVPQEKTVSTARGTTIPSVVTFYEISAQGIERIEGPSQFEPPNRYPGINIQATGSSVITLGDGNFVNVRHRHVFEKLSDLKYSLSTSESLTEEQKLEVAVDIETIKDQLAKSEPDRDVVRGLWPRIEKVATMAGIGGAAAELAQAAQNLLR